MCVCGVYLGFECVCVCAVWHVISGCWDQGNQARDTLTFSNGSNDLLSSNI